MSNIKEIFQKAPIKEVITELRFNTNLSVMTKIDEFHNKVQQDFPNIVLPIPVFEKHPLGQSVQLLNSEKDKRIELSSENLSYSTLQYNSFSEFKGNFLKIINDFNSLCPTIKTIKRFGLRYINNIPCKKEISKTNFSPSLNFNINFPDIFNHNNAIDFESSCMIEIEKGVSGVRINIQNKPNQKGNDFIVLDFDLISFKEIQIDKIEQYLTEYHEKIEAFFLSIITEKYKENIR